MTTLSRDEYRDKVYACWLGKNCGGTLGAPLEKAFAQEEPFAIDWYPELREGGIPNDDLEMQLIWLKAVEEVGFDLTARDLAQYWLDHIGYNWDEYGLNKTNLRLGLEPPVSGHYNNWFVDCMGSPIRSEIWACLAPGLPALAVRYAYEDASVDHAGGEGVWGELFNAAVQSAAFVERDPHTLLDIGLSYIPSACVTARAVRAAREAHMSGVDWRAARERVRAVAPSYVAQYAPANIGFQVIGWLYGRDFGDALCTAVNCGYDTDCTGATLGALLGIIGGRAGLPERWTAPLGETIATNESWGGLRGASTGRNPVPATLGELTDRVCRLGERLLASRGAPVRIDDTTDLRDATDLRGAAGDTSRDEGERWQTTSVSQLEHRLQAVVVRVDYGGDPVIASDRPTDLTVLLRNRRSDALTLDVALRAPADWVVEPAAPRELALEAYGDVTLRYTVRVADPAAIHNSNTLQLDVRPHSRPAEPAIPVVLVGARRWLLWGPEGAADATALLDQPLAAEQRLDALPTHSQATEEGWRVASANGNALPDEIGTSWTGTLYARLFLWNPEAREARLGVPATCPRKLWLNGHLVHEVRQPALLRPNYGGDSISYVDVTLNQGWNALSIKYTRDTALPSFAAHLTLSTTGLYDGLTDVRWTRLPWDDKDAKRE